MYNMEYLYGALDEESDELGFGDFSEGFSSDINENSGPKGYIPPTPPEEFYDVLGAPMGE